MTMNRSSTRKVAARSRLQPEGLGTASILDWLRSDECRARDEVGLIADFGWRLKCADLPIDRLVSLRWTLHPSVLGRAVTWAPGRPVEIYDRDHGIEPVAAFAVGRLYDALAAGRPLTLRGEALTLSAIDALTGRDLVELAILPLAPADGPFRAMCFGTARKGGFAAPEHLAFAALAPALAARLGAAARVPARLKSRAR
jgi:hypothetical protein